MTSQMRKCCALGACLLVAAATVPAGGDDPNSDDARPGDFVVEQITSIELVIEKIKPPILVVTAKGLAPAGAGEQGLLERVLYTKPPADGVQEYVLCAIPPAGPAEGGPIEVTGRNEWRDFERDAPWLKGVRIYGVGDGVKEQMLDEQARAAATVDFGGLVRFASAPSQCRFLGATSVAVEVDSNQADIRSAMLQLDENKFVFLNDFGDAALTQIYFAAFPVGLDQLKRGDPLQLGRRIYEVRMPPSRPVPLDGGRLRLVLPERGSREGARLVLSDRQGTVIRTLNLERMTP